MVDPTPACNIVASFPDIYNPGHVKYTCANGQTFEAITSIPTPTVPSIAQVHSSVGQNVLPNYLNPVISFISQAIHIYMQNGVLISLGISFIAFALIALILFFRYKLFEKEKVEEYVLLKIHPPSDSTQSHFATEQLFTAMHSLGSYGSFWSSLLGKKKTVAFELVSTKNGGVRYIVRLKKQDAGIFKKDILSFSPEAKMEEVDDYLPDTTEQLVGYSQILELKLKNHFTLPLQKQDTLAKHDPIAYIAGHMTKLQEQEIISLQVIVTPLLSNFHKKQAKILDTMETHVYHGLSISHLLRKDIFVLGFIGKILHFLIMSVIFCILTPLWLASFWSNEKSNEMFPLFLFQKERQKKYQELSPSQQEEHTLVGEKIRTELFETTIRVLIAQNSKQAAIDRARGIISSLAPFTNGAHQGFILKRNFPFVRSLSLFRKLSYLKFKHRLLSFLISPSDNPILSVSEVSSLYHFPYTTITKTENMVKSLSRDLPAPLSFKQGTKYDVILGKNIYGGEETPIGLTGIERERHEYMIGGTGNGKSTMMFYMIMQDIQSGKGVIVIDPHGDLAKKLINCIPEKRKNDLIYFNPTDFKHPIRINLLELTPGLPKEQAKLEKEMVCESVISLFRKLFDKEEQTNAHRIEHVLRNTIYTALTLPDSTLETVYYILSDSRFRKKVTANLEDPILKLFWKGEFDKAGNWQQVKKMEGITSKLGRFLTSESARRVIKKPKSTISFDDILDSGKILICNFSKEVGEDIGDLFGTMVLAKIQLAAYKRARTPENKRNPAYLYVDEFQNYATLSFIKMLSEIRKYKVFLTIAEQTTSQQKDKDLIDTIFANVGTIICFRTANPKDEEYMLSLFSSYVKKGEIMNLPAFHFFIKILAITPQEPFSGEIIFERIAYDEKKFQKMIEASRKNYTTEYTEDEENALDTTSNLTVGKDTPSKAVKESKAKESKQKDPSKPMTDADRNSQTTDDFPENE